MVVAANWTQQAIPTRGFFDSSEDSDQGENYIYENVDDSSDDSCEDKSGTLKRKSSIKIRVRDDLIAKKIKSKMLKKVYTKYKDRLKQYNNFVGEANDQLSDYVLNSMDSFVDWFEHENLCILQTFAITHEEEPESFE